MKQTALIMGMPISVEVLDTDANGEIFKKIFNYLEWVDEKFSTYKSQSEISRINRGELLLKQASTEMKEVFELSEKTKKETLGYFDICNPKGYIDPSGLVKGWAINKAAKMIENEGFKNFYIEAGGDIQSRRNENKEPWKVGIRNPFNRNEVIKVLNIRNEGVATSGSYIRGRHIYDPHKKTPPPDEIVSITVVGPDIYETDRFATAAFAMGQKGILFIEDLKGFEAYQIDKNGIAIQTSGLKKYLN